MYPYFYNKNRSFKRKRQFYSNFLLWFAITVLIKKTNFNFLNLVESKFRPKMFMTSNVSYEGKKGSQHWLQIEDGCSIEPPDAVPTTTTTTTTETTTTEQTTTSIETTTTTTITTTTTESHWSYCTFQTDLCGYIIDEHAPENYFFFDRKTGQQLTDEGVHGPAMDHWGQKDS